MKYRLPSAKKHKGFTLIEVLAAVLLIVIGALGAFSLVQQVVSFISISSSRLTAAYLSLEGVEIVRNIRDGNYLSGLAWDEGILEGDQEADYQSQSLSPFDGGRFLNIEDADGFYGYSPGTPTPFKRKIIIDKSESDTIKIEVQVSWDERGRTHQFSVRENLYKWF